MNGPHDLGGQHGMGPIAPEWNEPTFHAEWEKRALGITLSCGAFGAWTLDESRHARESLPPATYLSASYYEIWTRALETLLKRHGFLTEAELDAGRMLDKWREPKRVLAADMVAGVLAKELRATGRWKRRRALPPARACVRRTSIRRVTHASRVTPVPGGAWWRPYRAASSFRTTTLTAGARIRNGSIPSSSAPGRSGARARTRRIPSPSMHGRATLNLYDASLARSPLLASAELPKSREGDPVFAEPWQAAVFAMTVRLHEQGVLERMDGSALDGALQARPQARRQRLLRMLGCGAQPAVDRTLHRLKLRTRGAGQKLEARCGSDAARKTNRPR